MKSPFIQLWNVLTIPAFGFADRWIKNSVICVIVLAAAASVPARAANHAVLSSCANNGDGTSWSCASTNGGAGAFNAIPSTLARGDSYYFGVGNYTGVGPLTLSTADSGASLITWKATTAADYGGLSGFNSSTMVGQAVLPPLDVTSDYWNIDGVYSPNGDENTEPFFPAQCPIANQTVHSSTYEFITCSNSGYGFKIENWSGNDCSSGPCAPVATWAFDAAFLTSGNNITLQFTDVEGSMDQTSGTDGCDMALAINVGGTHSGGSNIHILYDYMHDQILGNYFDATQNTWVDHVYALRNTVCSSSHAELFGVRNTGSGTYNTVNWVLSNSIIGMGSSTAFWNTPNGGTGIDSIWIFGNIFYCNQGEFTSNSKCDAGDGFIMTEKESGGGFNPFVIVNNDFDGAGPSSDGHRAPMQVQLAAGSPGWFDTFSSTSLFENNLFSNPPDSSAAGNMAFTCDSQTTDAWLGTAAYTAWAGTNAVWGKLQETENCPASVTDSASSPTFGQLITSNPYVNAGTNVAGAENYSLVSDTNAGTSLSSLPPPNGNIGVDMLGHTRTTWSRGALEFAGPTVTPAPALGMFAWDWDPLEGIAP